MEEPPLGMLSSRVLVVASPSQIEALGSCASGLASMSRGLFVEFRLEVLNSAEATLEHAARKTCCGQSPPRHQPHVDGRYRTRDAHCMFPRHGGASIRFEEIKVQQ